MNFCWQSNASAFKYAVYIGHCFSSKEKAYFNFMAAITICSGFGAPQNKVSHCFHYFPIYFPWIGGTGCHDLIFWMLSLANFFSLSSYFFSLSSSRGTLILLHFLPYGCCHLHIWGFWYFSRQSWFQLVLHPSQRFSWYTLHINRVTIYRLDVLLSQFGTHLLFHVQF